MPNSGSRGLSDEEILRIGMHYGDPSKHYDLLSSEKVPKHPEWVRLVDKYKCKDSVNCMRPGCGQPHNEGAVVEITTISESIGLINIGHDCGEALFPEEYVAGVTRYDADLQRKNLIIRKREVLAREIEIMQWFEMTRGLFQEYDEARRAFEAFMPELLADIRSALRLDGGDLVVVEVSSGKIFKEALEAEGIRSRIQTGVTMVHRVMGPHFYSKGELVARAAKAADECNELLGRLRPDNLPVAQMRVSLDRLRTVGEKMQKMVFQYRDMFDALSTENLRGLAQWIRKVAPEAPYEFMNGGLLRYADGGLPEYFLEPKSGVAPQPIDNFPLFRAA
ncbi:MAG: hypothetical protein IH900_05275 [Proteobacteria bacterium]|nr:hypothetical protein [Pseudomonadota bacterium]